MRGRTHASPVDAGGSSTVGLPAATEGVLAFLVPHHKHDFQKNLDFFFMPPRLSWTTGGGGLSEAPPSQQGLRKGSRDTFEALPMRCS
jgi:hypothetical protein